MTAKPVKVPIFYYHSVGAAPPQTLALATFRRHLELIRRHGYATVTVADYLRQPRPKTVVLAFDDGLLDNYENVFPLLLDYGMKATFYVVPGYDGWPRYVDPSRGRWSDVPAAAFTQTFLSMGKAQRSELARHGMEIGSHSLTHRMLTHVPIRELRAEVAGSKAWLEDELGRSVETFCYPRGRFGPRVLREVRAAGYRGACSTLPGYAGSCPFVLRRFLVERPGYFEAVLLGRAFHPAGLARLLS